MAEEDLRILIEVRATRLSKMAADPIRVPADLLKAVQRLHELCLQLEQVAK